MGGLENMNEETDLAKIIDDSGCGWIDQFISLNQNLVHIHIFSKHCVSIFAKCSRNGLRQRELWRQEGLRMKNKSSGKSLLQDCQWLVFREAQRPSNDYTIASDVSRFSFCLTQDSVCAIGGLANCGHEN